MASGVYDNIYGYASTYIQVAVEYTETYSVANNSSDVTVALWYKRTNSYSYDTYAYGDWQVLVNGTWYSVYNGTFTIPANNNNWLKVGEKQVKNIAHNNDGTKSISVGGWFANQGSGTSVMDFDIRDTIALTPIPRASKASVNPNPLVLSSANNTLTVKTNRASSSFTHTVKVTCGTWESTQTNVGSETTFSIPKTIISQMTATEMNCSVTTTTYNGSTQIGSATTTAFKVAVDTTQEHASVSSVSLEDTNQATSAIESAGTFIKGASNLKATIPLTVVGSYTTLASATVSIDGVTQTYTLSGTSQTIIFTKSGVVGTVLTIKVTDNRGYTVTDEVDLTIIPYEVVQINTAQIYRCNSNGDESETGTYIHYEVEVKCFKGSFGNVSNTLTLYKADKTSSDPDYGTETTLDTDTASGAGVIGTYRFSGETGGSYSASSQYDIKFTVRDLFSESEYVIVLLRGVPIFSGSDNRFCVYGELDVHDKNDTTKYLPLSLNNVQTIPVSFSGADGGSVNWNVFSFGSLRICTARWTDTNNRSCSTAWGGMYVCSRFNTPNYPVTFSAVNYQNMQMIQVDASNPNSAILIPQSGTTQNLTSYGEVYLARGTSATVGHPVYVQIVVGTV